MGHPFVLRHLCSDRLLHLRLDEKLQDVRVVLVPAGWSVATVTSEGDADVVVLWAQNQIAVVESSLHGLVHDVEPGPGLDHSTKVLLILVWLLQVLTKKCLRPAGRHWYWFYDHAPPVLWVTSPCTLFSGCPTSWRSGLQSVSPPDPDL